MLVIERCWMCNRCYFSCHISLSCTLNLCVSILRQQALSFSSGEGVHTDFENLNANINSPSASYILKTANRLYGEKTANFLTVSFFIWPQEAKGEVNVSESET